jgi:metal-responsive CopG/Arc/MetJ family transcriptional regulator
MTKAYEKILLRTELLFLEIIDEFVDKRKYHDRTDFINEAIKEKLEKEFGSLEPKEILIYGKNWEL